MNKIRKLLFFGELPPGSIHGIAISNRMNLDLLGKYYKIDIIEEISDLSDHDKTTARKFIRAIKNNFRILIKSARLQYDYFYLVFSLSTFGSFKTLFAIINFRIFNRGKVVLHIHRGDFFSRFQKKKINRFITKLIVRLTHKFIVLSETQKKEFDDFFNKKCYVLNNAVEVEIKPEIKQQNHTSFIYVSNYLIDKGIIDLLEVFSQVTRQNAKVTLNTFGSFSDKKLKETIFNYSSANIRINEAISGIDKFNQIANSSCLILPSWNEGQPIVLLEAMSVGTPVISTSVGLIPEILGDNYPYLYTAGDRNSLKMKIIEFIENEDSNIISEELLSRYNRLFSKQQHAESLFKIFN
jgi:glycosyltransferase involved in cell wall biosynthesis